MVRILILAVSMLVAFGGCKASQGGGQGGALKTEMAANLKDYDIQRVAILGFANTSGDREAEEMAGYVSQALFETGKYYFATMSEFEHDANRADKQSDHERLQRTWQKKRTVDEEVVSRVLEATNYDAMVCMEFTKWEEIKLDPTQEGTSDTSVGLEVSLFARDGTLLWWASDLKTEESVPYLPSFNTRSTGSGEAATTSAAAVPDPPRIETVAMGVAREVVATLPDIKGNGTSSGGD